MNSGRGITHSERFEELRANGGPMDGIQAWVALPDEREETDPGFWHYTSQALPVFDGDGIVGRLIAGRLAGVESPVKVDWKRVVEGKSVSVREDLGGVRIIAKKKK